MSARDSSSAWELRCEIREKLVTWIQQHHPEALPRVRAEIDDASRTGLAGARAEA